MLTTQTEVDPNCVLPFCDLTAGIQIECPTSLTDRVKLATMIISFIIIL